MIHRKRRSSHPRRSSGRIRRFGSGIKTTHIASVGGALLAGYGILGPTGGGSPTPFSGWQVVQAFGGTASNPSSGFSPATFLQNVPLYGTNATNAINREYVGLGIGAILAAKFLPSILPSVRKLSFKIGRKRKLSVF